MADWNLAAKIFFGIAGACVVLILIVFVARRMKQRSLEHSQPPADEPEAEQIRVIPGMDGYHVILTEHVETREKPSEKILVPIEYDPVYITSLQNRIEALERRLTQSEHRLSTSWLMSDNPFKVGLALIGYIILMQFTLIPIAFALLCVSSIPSNVKNVPWLSGMDGDTFTIIVVIVLILGMVFWWGIRKYNKEQR